MSPWGCKNRCFLVALCRMIVRGLNLEVASKRLLYQQVKIPVLVACHRWKCVFIAISSGVDICKVPECHWKDSITHRHGIAVYVKEELSFPQDFSLKNCGFLLLFWTAFTSPSALLLLPISITFFIFMHVFDFI